MGTSGVGGDDDFSVVNFRLFRVAQNGRALDIAGINLTSIKRSLVLLLMYLIRFGASLVRSNYVLCFLQLLENGSFQRGRVFGFGLIRRVRILGLFE